MKNLTSPSIERYRIPHPAGDMEDELRPWAGAFQIPHKSINGTFVKTVWLRVIASRGGGGPELFGDDPHTRWDHVSVSLPDRCPTWSEMCAIKEMFFERWEPAMQLHPVKDYVNNHPFCLHLWRPLDAEIPLPAAEMVGIPGLELSP